ncbi:HpcH/HpaI aldolase/citrate lyase family protein [Microvirga antarctica]|uniref:HpcH/HpaI aldolase/citrate lyase family protein n=1 Tax=Microvirga antarctica TaxID=2819233 RepID=UPI001B313B68|nr:CoA ester lyase [Microvirga antarctica]
MKQARPRRSVLYVPAANAKAMAKVENLACDAVIFDLEDAVAPALKAEARTSLQSYFRERSHDPKERVIRINALASAWGAEDLAVAAASSPTAILLPKVETAEQVLAARSALDAAGATAVRLWAMIETPLGIVNIREIAALGAHESVGLECFVAGTNDIAKETGLSIPAGRATMVLWLAQVVIHARAFGIDILDGVYNDFRNQDGFLAECAQGAEMGFDGKTLIHPTQIEPANGAFSPSEAAIAEARAVVALFSAPENVREGVLTLNGKMVERLHADMARRTLAKAGLPLEG